MIGQLVYKLPGHNGSVNDVDFHPKEPIRKLTMQSKAETIPVYSTPKIFIAVAVSRTNRIKNASSA